MLLELLHRVNGFELYIRRGFAIPAQVIPKLPQAGSMSHD